MSLSKSQGFSLIELVAVIVIVGILAAMTTSIITLPVNGYLDLQRRTTLVDTAELALRRMQRDIRRALPNSVRTTPDNTAIEMIHIADGGRYRAKKASDGSGDILDFEPTSDISFDVIGNLSAAPAGELVIHNLGENGSDPYTMANRCTTVESCPSDAYAGFNRATLENTSTSTKIFLKNTKLFPKETKSEQQRFYVVDTPITYLCFNNQLLRYTGYAYSPNQPNPPSSIGQIEAVQANKIASCKFVYTDDSGTTYSSPSRSGQVTLTITLTDAAGESVQLMHQVHVDNMP